MAEVLASPENEELTAEQVAERVINTLDKYRSDVRLARESLANFEVKGPIGVDLETADADQLFTYGPRFVRIGGLINAQGGIGTGSDMTELVAKLGQAEEIYAHNWFTFDGLALARYHGLDWEKISAKVVDTEPLARQAHPPRSRTHGSADEYTLDAVAERLGVPGKTADLKSLKRAYGAYDSIPLDAPEYHEYLRGDLRASQAIRHRLPQDAYTRREHRIMTMFGRMTLNGFKVDVDLLNERNQQGEARKQAALEELHEAHGLPLGREVMRGRGKAKRPVYEPFSSPLATTEGIVWLAGVWRRFGRRRPPLTPGGELSTAADALNAVALDPRCPAELVKIIELMSIVTTTRTVYGTALTYLTEDGRVHPSVSMRQASGRASITKPGMTVFGKRGGRHVEREIFVADEGHVIITCDASQVDMRAIAAHSQDRAYMALFAPGRDAHQEIADMLGISRDDAKARGHGWNYGLGANAMIRDGADPQVVYRFIHGMESRFPRLIAWREHVRAIGSRGDLLNNGFGRMMRCDPKAAYTMAPALMGQGCTRDLVCESLLRLPESYWPYLRTFVHDEVVMSVPEDKADHILSVVRDAFTSEWRGVPILCDTAGPAANWGAVSHK